MVSSTSVYTSAVRLICILVMFSFVLFGQNGRPDRTCTGSRPELLNYPPLPRVARATGTVVAHVTIDGDGRTAAVKIESTQRMFEETVRTLVQQATFPVGCEGRVLDLVFEFVMRDAVSERADTIIEVLPPGKYRITTNKYPAFTIAD